MSATSSPPCTLLINGKWRLLEKINSGGFGVVFKAENTMTLQLVAVKLEQLSDTTRPRLLEHEYKVYQSLPYSTRFPSILWFGLYVDDHNTRYHAMVMTLHGPSLQECFELNGGQPFTLKTITMTAIAALRSLEALHKNGYACADVKPENFLMSPQSPSILVLCDLGLAESFVDETGKCKPAIKTSQFKGTLRYATVKAQQGFLPTPQGDLISLMYMLVYLYVGSLPWDGIEESTPSKTKKAVLLKKKIASDRLFDSLPPQFSLIWQTITHLPHGQPIPYKPIKKLLYQVFTEKKWNDDCRWCFQKEEYKIRLLNIFTNTKLVCKSCLTKDNMACVNREQILMICQELRDLRQQVQDLQQKLRERNCSQRMLGDRERGVQSVETTTSRSLHPDIPQEPPNKQRKHKA